MAHSEEENKDETSANTSGSEDGARTASNQTSRIFLLTPSAWLILSTVSGLFTFALVSLADRAPRPSTQFEATDIEGFNLDLNRPPGYTVGEIHHFNFFDSVAISMSASVAFFSLLVALLLVLYILSVEDKTVGRTILVWSVPILHLFILIFIFERSIEFYSRPAYLNHSMNVTEQMTYTGTNETAYGVKQSRSTDLVSIWTNLRFLAIWAAESVFLLVIARIYNRELIPSGLKSRDGKYLEYHTDLWWRYTQIILSIGLAGTVGLSVPLVLKVTPFKFYGVFGVGLILFTTLASLLIFSSKKMHAISEYLIENGML